MANNVKRYSMRFRQRVVERMQLEKNISQLSRELGLDRSMMYIWKRKLEKRAYGNVRSGTVNVRDRQIQELQAGSPGWKGSLGGRLWNWIFSKVPCGGPGEQRGRAARVAGTHLCRNPRPSPHARRTNRSADVRTGGRQSRQLLSKLGTERADRRRDGGSRCDSESRARASLLRLSPNRRASSAAGIYGESEEGPPVDGGG